MSHPFDNPKHSFTIRVDKEQEQLRIEEQDFFGRFTTQILETKDKVVRQGLIMLGWKPPSEGEPEDPAGPGYSHLHIKLTQVFTVDREGLFGNYVRNVYFDPRPGVYLGEKDAEKLRALVRSWLTKGFSFPKRSEPNPESFFLLNFQVTDTPEETRTYTMPFIRDVEKVRHGEMPIPEFKNKWGSASIRLEFIQTDYHRPC